MNKSLIIALAAETLFATLAPGQGFMNLDFERASNLPLPETFTAVTNALPDWSVFYGSNQLSIVSYNVATYLPPVDLFGSNTYVLDGNFSVLLSRGATISQTGMVPMGTQSLLFDLSTNAPFSLNSLLSMIVSLNGQNLSYTAVSNALNYTVYGADISAFAGQVATLSFSIDSKYAVIDDIQFSDVPVPEPGTLALQALAAAFWFMLFGADIVKPMGTLFTGAPTLTASARHYHIGGDWSLPSALASGFGYDQGRVSPTWFLKRCAEFFFGQ